MRFPISDYKLWINYNYTNYKQNILQIASHEYDYNDEDIQDIMFGKIGFDYFRGHAFSVRALQRKVKPHFLSSMLTSNGYVLDANIKYEFNNFMNGFSISEEYSTIGANFEPNNTFRFNLNFSYFNNYKNNIFMEISSIIGFISNQDVDDFFYFFGGGLPGLKGYTYYEESLTGSGLAIASIHFRKLLLDKRFLSFYDFIGFDKLSVGIVGQMGNAYNTSFKDLYEELKFSSGLELRAKGFMFYGYPLAITIEHHLPIADDVEKSGKTYMRFLFDF